jgi:hypothetical protein
MTAECHTSFTDPSATANDACDGSLAVTPSGSVLINTVGDYTLTYSATDSSSHTGTNIRVVHVIDTTMPVITVNPGASTIALNATYNDPSATASDTCAGSVAVTPSGSVNTAVAGTYTLTYSATDPSGNTATANRTVQVIDLVQNVFITTSLATLTNVPEGTNVVFTAHATGSDPKTYQWYLGTDNSAPIGGATSSNYTFNAFAIGSPVPTNVFYHVIVDNVANVPAPSTNINIKIIVDKAPPVLVLTQPKANARSNSTDFVMSGTATESKLPADAIGVVYYYTNHIDATHTATFGPYTNDISTFGPTPIKRQFSNVGMVAPPVGTNDLAAYALSQGGNLSLHPFVVKGLFSRYPITYHLTIGGDGGGSVTATTKATGEHVTPLPVQDVSGTTDITLYQQQIYTFKFIPDTSKAKNPVLSVVSNAPCAVVVDGSSGSTGTDSIKVITYTFTAGTSDMTSSVYFNRNRRTDMNGTYVGVFSVPGAPDYASAGEVTFILQASGVYTAKINNSGTTVAAVYHGKIAANGTMTASGNGYTLTGTVNWDSQPNVVKQFTGTVDGSWTGDATFVADRGEHLLLTAGTKRTLIMPSAAGGPAGTNFATIIDSTSTHTLAFSLADGATTATASGIACTGSGRCPIFVYPHYSATKDPNGKSVLFGTWDTTTSTATLNWVKEAGGVYVPAGFTNADVATISGFSTGLTGTHTVGITNGSFGISYVMTFPGGLGAASKLSGSTNSISIHQNAAGVLNVTFGNGKGSTGKTTGTAIGLDNAQTGGGFFIPTAGNPASGTGHDSGFITIQ